MNVLRKVANFFRDAPYAVPVRVEPGKLDLSGENLAFNYRANSTHATLEQKSRTEYYDVARLLDVRAPNYVGKLPDPVGCQPDNIDYILGKEFEKAGESLERVLIELSQEISRGNQNGVLGSRLHEGLACLLQRLTHEMAFVPREYSAIESGLGLGDLFKSNPLKVPTYIPDMPLPFHSERSAWCRDVPIKVNLGRALNQVLVPMCTTNLLRAEIPTFTFCYGFFFMDDPKVETAVPYLLMEEYPEPSWNIVDAVKSANLSNYRDKYDHFNRLELLFSTFIQVFAALAMAYERFGFVHNDLQAHNVHVIQLDDPVTLFFDLGNYWFTIKTSVIAKINNYTCAHVNLPITGKFHEEVRFMFDDDQEWYMLADKTMHTGVLNYATFVAPTNPRPLTDICRLISSFVAQTNDKDLMTLYRWLISPLFGGSMPDLEVIHNWHTQGRGAAPPGIDMNPTDFVKYLIATQPNDFDKFIVRGPASYSPTNVYAQDALKSISPYLNSITKPATPPLPMLPTPQQIAKRPLLFDTKYTRAQKRCTYDAVGDFKIIQETLAKAQELLDGVQNVKAAKADPRKYVEIDEMIKKLQACEVIASTLVSAEYAYGPLQRDEYNVSGSAVLNLYLVRSMIREYGLIFGQMKV